MESPVTIADREHRLLQLNAELDHRYKDLIHSPSFRPTKGTKTPSAESRVSRKALPESVELLRKPFVYHEPINPVPNPKPKIPIPTSEVKARPKANLARSQLDERRNLSTEATIKFLKAKVSILQQELEVSRADQTTQSAVIAKQQDDAKKLTLCADRLASQNKTLTEQVDKLQTSLVDARNAVTVSKPIEFVVPAKLSNLCYLYGRADEIHGIGGVDKDAGRTHSRSGATHTASHPVGTSNG